ncbi:MAG: hypothetical protein V7607_5712 [Solirubrobacteraceae bacterium]
MNDRLNVIVVGVGFMGEVHARVISDSPLADLRGVVDSDPAVAQTVGARLGVSAFTDIREAIERTQPDAAIIATPDHVHREAAEIAIEEGVAILVEKPLATTVEDADAMVRLARERGTRLMPGHILRFDTRYIQVAELVRAGELGRPLVLRGERWDRTSFGVRVAHVTSPLWYFLIHDIDLVQWIGGGTIQDIAGAVSVESPEGQSAFTATGSLSTGATFHLAGGWTLPEGVTSPSANLEVHGERSHAAIQVWEEGLRISSASGTNRGAGPGWPMIYGHIDGLLRREVEHFLRAIAEDTPFAVTPDEALDAVRGAAALEAASVHRHVGEPLDRSS